MRPVARFTRNNVMKAAISLAISVFAAGEARAGACDDLARQVQARTHAAIVEVSPRFGNVQMRHPAAADMTIECTTPPGLNVGYEGDANVRYVALVSIAGAIVIGAAVQPSAVANCLLAAAVDPSGQAERDAGRAHLFCMASPESRSGSVEVSLADGG